MASNADFLSEPSAAKGTGKGALPSVRPHVANQIMLVLRYLSTKGANVNVVFLLTALSISRLSRLGSMHIPPKNLQDEYV